MNRTFHLPTRRNIYSAYHRRNNIILPKEGEIRLQYLKDVKSDIIPWDKETFLQRRKREKKADSIIKINTRKNDITIKNKLKQQRILKYIRSMTRVPGPHRGKSFDEIGFIISNFGL